ncbi:MurR/RpiR family transcriptional regulator [Clostridium sp. Sa3CUN1]|uniref:MurR/RpiR family transcriptional regulator n=1 Tax=Clostridium gallinarum TaxID=2762246 RepID=A0ABR8Q2L9_9CLOT|nr:MurR/RpiR family transcriptional regulator [Clostridium gallinarum]MBD7914663.1 MurR/RpiR family transcriptional regulator [Clostridium gallinarum]
MDFYKMISTNTDKLNKNELDILNFCMKHADDIKSIRINDLAENTYTSPASIVRFCKKLGFAGFSEFKASFSLNIKNTEETFNNNFNENSPNLFKDINKSIELINEDILEEILELLHNANRIEFFGEGSSRIVCSEVAKKFRTIGKTAFNYDDSSMMYIAATSLTSNDLIFAISVSGETIQVLKALNIAKSRGAKIISLTDLSNNSQSKLADKSIYVTSTSFVREKYNIVSRTQALIIAEYIFFRYLEKYL